ncbi:hypothetical protein RF55_9640 [Lasius niger]|uniref:Uncharacterized protein n=1 Tax=Lasius niger TaxID=67767 RepID=A0A0J7KK43_LASNI|nr:hypothetical protein RF55_9640 [Lasius niger]
MRILKNSAKNIDWTAWTKRDREEEIRKEIDKLAPPNVMENLRLNEEDMTEEGHLNEEFSREEMKRALEMIRRNSAPARDGIEYRMLKDLPDEMKNIMLEIFNEIWITGIILEEWRKYQVYFIDKVEKEKVRPI